MPQNNDNDNNNKHWWSVEKLEPSHFAVWDYKMVKNSMVDKLRLSKPNISIISYCYGLYLDKHKASCSPGWAFGRQLDHEDVILMSWWVYCRAKCDVWGQGLARDNHRGHALEGLFPHLLNALSLSFSCPYAMTYFSSVMSLCHTLLPWGQLTMDWNICKLWSKIYPFIL